jgi:membrane protease YdiL (CAAX protease family)
MLQMMFAGACFGWAKIWSGSTGAATVMHCTFNLVAFAAFLLSQGQPAQ